MGCSLAGATKSLSKLPPKDSAHPSEQGQGDVTEIEVPILLGSNMREFYEFNFLPARTKKLKKISWT